MTEDHSNIREGAWCIVNAEGNVVAVSMFRLGDPEDEARAREFIADEYEPVDGDTFRRVDQFNPQKLGAPFAEAVPPNLFESG